VDGGEPDLLVRREARPNAWLVIIGHSPPIPVLKGSRSGVLREVVVACTTYEALALRVNGAPRRCSQRDERASARLPCSWRWAGPRRVGRTRCCSADSGMSRSLVPRSAGRSACVLWLRARAVPERVERPGLGEARRPRPRLRLSLRLRVDGAHGCRSRRAFSRGVV
jgi:hypothetical protein